MGPLNFSGIIFSIDSVDVIIVKSLLSVNKTFRHSLTFLKRKTTPQVMKFNPQLSCQVDTQLVRNI